MKKLLLLLFILLNITITANAATEVTLETKITGLYIAFFNRAADEGGLTYWTNRGNSSPNQSTVLKELAAGFAQHPSFDRAYGELNNRSFVEEIYKNALGREGDTPGIDYWSGRLNLPLSDPNYLSRSDFVSVFVEAALTFDRNDPQYAGLSEEDLNAAQLRHDLLANKAEAGLAFTHQLGTLSNVSQEHHDDPENDPAYLASIKIISEVTEERSTVTAVLSFLDSIRESNDPIKEILEGASVDTPMILSLTTEIDGCILKNVLAANKKSKLRLSGLEESSVKVVVSTSRGIYEIPSVTVSTEEQIITFSSPVNVVEGNLSVMDTVGNILTTMPYTLMTAHTPYLKVITPDIVNAGESVTLSGVNLPSTPVKIVFEGQSGSLIQTVTPTGDSVNFTVPQDAASGNIYLQINQVESNRLYFSVKRNIEVKVVLSEVVDMNASDISFTMGMETYPLDENFRVTLNVENEDTQYINAMVQMPDGNVSLLYSAVILPDMSGTVTVDANSTAVSWIFMGLGATVVADNDALHSLYESVVSNVKVQAFADYLGTLQKNDFNKWMTLDDATLEEKFRDALIDVVQTQQQQASRARMLARSLPESNSLVKITQTPENDNIYFENRKSDGNIWIINDTRLFMSVAVTSKEADEEYNIEYKHPISLIDMQFVNGIIKPKGWPLLGLSSEKKLELDGIDSSIEVIIGAYDGDTDKKEVAKILRARTFLDGIISPITNTILSTLLKKGISPKDPWKNVIDGMEDIYGKNFIKQLQTSVSTQSNGWWATADTLLMMPIKRGMKGCLKVSFGYPDPEKACKNTVYGLLKISGAYPDLDNAYNMVKVKIISEIGEQVVKNAIAVIPYGGWIARIALFVYENSGEIGTAITIGESVIDMTNNPPEINADVEFALDITKVDPMCIVIPSDIGSQSYSFGITGEGFTADDGALPYVKLLVGGVEIQTDDVMMTNEGTQILALFPEPLDLIANGSDGNAGLFVGYNDGLWMMYPTPIRIIDPNDDVVYFDTIVPSSAHRGATVTLKGCGWVPTDDIKVYFSKEFDEYVEGEILSKTEDTIRVNVPEEARSGTVYVTAGNKTTKKLFFDINPFSFNDLEEDDKAQRKESISLTGASLSRADKLYVTDHTGKKMEVSIDQSSDDVIDLTLPKELALGPVEIYAEDEDGNPTNVVTLPLVPKGVDAAPVSQYFSDSIIINLSQEENTDIFYRIDDEEEQQYTGPVTLKAEDAEYEYFSLYAYAQVTINDINYTSNELEYQYRPRYDYNDTLPPNPADLVHAWNDWPNPQWCPRINNSNPNGLMCLAIGECEEEDKCSCEKNVRCQYINNNLYWENPLLKHTSTGIGGSISWYVNDGIWKDYDYHTGQILHESPSTDGTLTGTEIRYYTSGLVSSIVPWDSSGKLNGTSTKYYESGTLKLEAEYKDGRLDGFENLYYLSGNLRYSYHYKTGELDGLQVSYYESGILRQTRTMVAGKNDGVVKSYYDISGALREETPYSNGEKKGVEKWYYESGGLGMETTWINDLKNGTVKKYYESGASQEETPYTDNLRNGTLKGYYESGALRHELSFVNGKAVGISYVYYESGILWIESAPYENGIRNGTTKIYYESGNLKEEAPYVDNKLHGDWKKYAEDGTLTSCLVYDMGTKTGSCMP